MRTIASILLFFLLLPLIAVAQTYKYIGVEDGLSNRRIYSIENDSAGYMWFFTNEGMDRYDGKNIQHYKLIEEGKEQRSRMIHSGWSYVDRKGNLWVIDKQGRVFHYDAEYDQFRMDYRFPVEGAGISYGYLDHDDTIWLCGKYSILFYDTKNGKVRQESNLLKSGITSIEQTEDGRFFVATESGVRQLRMATDGLQTEPVPALDTLRAQVNELYYHRGSRRLFVGTFEKGVFAYDLDEDRLLRPTIDLSDVNITRIRPLNADELLVATEGMGIYKVEVATCLLQPYIVAHYQTHNEMNGNNINDIYIDREQRIWVANYPEGITVIDNRYKNYNWIKHSIGNRQSLINDQVHAVIEDSEGDLWFGTSNGISLYSPRTKQWHSFLSEDDQRQKGKNCIFIALCEVSPGVIWAGGYTSGIYKIHKHSFTVEYFSPSRLTPNIRPDKYIRSIVKDSAGKIWSGGYYNLKSIEPVRQEVRLYPGISSVTAILEKDTDSMWIGTSTGLYLLDKESGHYRAIDLQEEATYVNALYQGSGNQLYIGTNGRGLLIYDFVSGKLVHYHKDNCALVSNSIFSILPEWEGNIPMSTENGISLFSLREKIFHNWTKEQGLMSSCFSASSGTLCHNGGFVFGSTDGAVEFPKGTRMPSYTYTGMKLTEFRIAYQLVYPGKKGSPLKQSIDATKSLRLRYDQNSFSFKISSINYDAPNNVEFFWKLSGSYDEWSPLVDEGILRFTNLASGSYTLQIRAISKEEPYLYFEERSIDIRIARPLWLSTWAIFGYLVVVIIVLGISLRFMNLNKQKKVSEEKTRFFINTAHDIRTPLTLIKAPLEDVLGQTKMDEAHVREGIDLALRNVDSLLQMTTNLINFERAEIYSLRLCISEHELNGYVRGVFDSFQALAQSKHIKLTFECNFSYLNVWFDKDKMDSILKNILSNALKYTPEQGEVTFAVCETKSHWKIEVRDTGIGIPAREQRKLFRLHFRGTNAVNAKITGSGIGLMLVRKLVRLHHGKIDIVSEENRGTTVSMLFPKGRAHYRNVAIAVTEPASDGSASLRIISPEEAKREAIPMDKAKMSRLLVVEDNDELRNYLVSSLSRIYNVQACVNGKEALGMVKEYWPELVISDVMMPEMRGDELCAILKQDIETSHIPILLLTALSDERHVLDGLKTGADEYIVKPFSLNILKARVANLLQNRALLRKRYANLELEAPEANKPAANCSNSLEWKFISSVKQHVEEHLTDPEFTVDTLCALMGMSRTSFYNKLKALTEQSPADYIRLIRLKRAAQLLEEGRCSVAEVADQTGFSDSKYFREVFKKHFKVSPSSYVKEKGVKQQPDNA